MTLPAGKSNYYLKLFREFRNEPYLFISLLLAGFIILIFMYSGFFSPEKNNYPVVCIHEKITGVPCASCGLSHSLSLILKGRISEAYEWNQYGMRIFLFFALQLVMRVVFSILFLKNRETRKQLVILDISGSIVMFFTAFLPMLEFIFRSLNTE